MSLDRRKFLSTAATLGAIAMTPFEELFASKPAFKNYGGPEPPPRKKKCLMH
jgi:hypothetical protein